MLGMGRPPAGPEREWAREFTFVGATGEPRPNFHVPRAFADALILHIVKNNLDDRLQPPLMLIIQGPPGEGKSVQTLEVCSRLGIDLIVLPGSSLSGVQEKDPVLILRNAYLAASNIKHVERRRTALLIEDLDTSIVATRPDRAYTVNSQLLSGALMFLCEDPYHFGDRQTERVPIIATGNDFTTLYSPLTRHGRAVFFDWVPDGRTKVDVVRAIFDSYLPPGELREIPRLIDHFADDGTPPVAFFKQLRDSIFDDLILDQLRLRERIDFTEIRIAVEEGQLDLRVDKLIEIGERVRARGPGNFL
jgi:hypothetical protein